ncbi:MAG: type II toxin-antitoxin system RelE/ParE family toxin [Oscillospiraceae bacterium]|nr:type II toxin-antitoxin system RelE/ParE family toxin [Oscillospiraceae bacterium]
MTVELKKQPKKYMDKCLKSDYAKISNALVKLETLQGDIKKLEGREDEYRVKIPPFRIVFRYDRVNKIIVVIKITTRGSAYKKG